MNIHKLLWQEGNQKGHLVLKFPQNPTKLHTHDFDELVYQKSLIESINRGLSDIEKGNVFTTKELRAELEKKRT